MSKTKQSKPVKIDTLSIKNDLFETFELEMMKVLSATAYKKNKMKLLDAFDAMWEVVEKFANSV